MKTRLDHVVTDAELGQVTDRVRKRARALLALSGETYEQRGEQWGLTRAQVGAMVSSANPTLRTLLALAKLLGVPVDRLVQEVAAERGCAPSRLEDPPGAQED